MDKQNIKYSERGKLGAQALNGDYVKKRQAAQKAAQTRKNSNPNAFIEMGRKGGRPKRPKQELQ
jgi:hypothetical protein